MIAQVMVFLLTVSAITAAAAYVAEWGARRANLPTRGIWLVALMAPWILLLTPLLPTGSAPPLVGELGDALGVELPGLVVGPGVTPGGAWLMPTLTAMWIGASVILGLALLRGHRTLRDQREGWVTAEVAGHQVFVSSDLGPAVAGILDPWIVLPRWILELGERELSLVVLHEEEHVRGGDPVLLASSLVLVVLSPWNPFAWIAMSALRIAMEVDCDRRVLRHAPDRQAYGESLISVAAGSSGFSPALAAFSETGRSLEKRILAMTNERRRGSHLTTFFCLALAALLGVQACSMESPAQLFDGDGQQADVTAGSPDAQASEERVIEVREMPSDGPASGEGNVYEARETPQEPSFTPFTDPPSVTNRDEIVAAMIEAYPPLLEDAGIGGRVVIFFFIDENGRVLNTRLHESSGHEALDRAALEVADAYRFEPARNGGEAVPVWVQFPITFVTR